MDTVGKGEGGTNGDSGTDIYTLPGVEWMAGGSCYVARGAQLGLCGDLEGWDGRGLGGGLRKRGTMYMYR